MPPTVLRKASASAVCTHVKYPPFSWRLWTSRLLILVTAEYKVHGNTIARIVLALAAEAVIGYGVGIESRAVAKA
jgi:hypothetical protein